MRKLIRKILNEEISSQVRRRIPTFEETFKHYRKAFIDYKIRNFEIYWNLIMETVSETLYHAWFINTVPDDDWDESEKYIQAYLTKNYYNKTEKMWEKKHRKRLNESKTINYPKLINDILSSYKEEDFICDIDVSYYNEVYEIAVKIDKKEFEKKYEKENIDYATILMKGYLDRLKRNIIRDIKTLLPVDVLVWFRQINCDKKINESEDNEEKTIQKNLIVLNKLISMFDYSEVCDMWVEYNSEDGDYEIRSKMSTKNHNTSALEKEFDFLENSIKYLGFTNCYVFRPYYVDQCEDEIKYMNESEEKKGKYINALEGLTEDYKNEDCVCDIKIEYKPEEEIYLINVILGYMDIDDKFDGHNINRERNYKSKLKTKIRKEVFDYLPITFFVEFKQTPRCSNYRKLQESEEKKPRLLSTIEEDGLYELISYTGLHINEIEQKVGQFSREVLERFIIDVVKEHHTDIDDDGKTYIIYLEDHPFDVVPIGNNDWVEQLIVTNNELLFLVTLYEEDEYGDLEFSSEELTPSKNLLYANIYEIAGQLCYYLVRGQL